MAGLWLACGHHRNGVLLAAISAELLAKTVLGTAPTQLETDLLNAFSWQRFEGISAAM